MVDTHSKMLSPLGPAEQLQGGSSEISASSLEMRLAAEEAMVAEWVLKSGLSGREMPDRECEERERERAWTTLAL
jgi:hypothetical protein